MLRDDDEVQHALSPSVHPKRKGSNVRSFLCVPADSVHKINKALALADAEALILDLEDSVHPTQKAAGRALVAQCLEQTRAQPDIWVRVNPYHTALCADDLKAIVAPGLAGVVLPKARDAHEVDLLSAALLALESSRGLAPESIKIIAIMTESAAAVLNAHSYAQGTRPRLAGLTWGAEDLAADLGALSNVDAHGHYTAPYQYARTACLLAAAAAGVEAIDAVFTNFRDLEGLKTECMAAQRDGFVAKLAIHPQQLSVIQASFTPTAEEMEQARAIVDAFAHVPESGVASLNGRMLDSPHLRQAQRILSRIAKK